MAKRKKFDHTRLAEGEATGHYHEARGKGVALFEAGTERELEAPSGAEVTHQEHGVVAIPAETYTVSKVKEQDHAANEAREVRD